MKTELGSIYQIKGNKETNLNILVTIFSQTTN